MANWISSKLKVAETFLQQIDQQAADSLGKNEKPRSDDELSLDSSSKSGGVVPLKDQLKKKAQEKTTNDYRGKLRSDPFTRVTNRESNKDAATSSSSEPDAVTKSSLTNSDWTELLSTSNRPMPTSAKRSNGVSAIRGLRKDGRKLGSSDSHLLTLEPKGSLKNNSSDLKLTGRSDSVPKNKVNNGVFLDGRLSSDGNEFEVLDSNQKASRVEPGNDSDYMKRIDLSQESVAPKPLVEPVDKVDRENNGDQGFAGDGGKFVVRDSSHNDATWPMDTNHSPDLLFRVEGGPSMKMGAGDDRNKLMSTTLRVDESNAASRCSVSENLKRSSSPINDKEADSDTGDSDSTSDFESEGEREERRKRREQFLAERAAIKAAEAIKERENIVAKLEGEKQSLEKILEERAKQQAQEASELQTTMMETMNAVELEKQKHSNTRMEALARLARLETANADLARSLATVQWNLEVEVNRVTELRQQIEQKEIALEGIERRISNVNKTGMSLNQLVASKGENFGQDLLEVEYSSVTEKMERLQDKARKLEANIEMTRKEIEYPTEVEVELKRRLGQLTDHLIQKQTQVEALSSEKATLLFRIEAILRLLDENESMLNIAESRVDLESGTWELSNSKPKHSFGDKVRTGRQHLGSLLWQLDAIISAGAVFLKRNSTARWWSLVYISFLHFWVVYILTSHSQVSDDGRSGAVISLENINNTARV